MSPVLALWTSRFDILPVSCYCWLQGQQLLVFHQLPPHSDSEGGRERARREVRSQPKPLDMRDSMEEAVFHRFPAILDYLEGLATRHSECSGEDLGGDCLAQVSLWSCCSWGGAMRAGQYWGSGWAGAGQTILLPGLLIFLIQHSCLNCNMKSFSSPLATPPVPPQCAGGWRDACQGVGHSSHSHWGAGPPGQALPRGGLC